MTSGFRWNDPHDAKLPRLGGTKVLRRRPRKDLRKGETATRHSKTLRHATRTHDIRAPPPPTTKPSTTDQGALSGTQSVTHLPDNGSRIRPSDRYSAPLCGRKGTSMAGTGSPTPEVPSSHEGAPSTAIAATPRCSIATKRATTSASISTDGIPSSTVGVASKAPGGKLPTNNNERGFRLATTPDGAAGGPSRTTMGEGTEATPEEEPPDSIASSRPSSLDESRESLRAPAGVPAPALNTRFHCPSATSEGAA
eukprot:GHVU01119387.1.p1 GENE.GHVU01119387.1~~GHVU01119387.1.p1  ORF type:complete len:253 (-),score=12.31 GHVU01119387.1:10-768(-)